jgi:hypothetical protein
LERIAVAKALRVRNIFIITSKRLVGLVSTELNRAVVIYGNEVMCNEEDKPVKLNYAFFGGSGFSFIEIYNALGSIFIANYSERPRYS